MNRTYKIASMRPARKDQAIVEIDLDKDGRETDVREFLSLPGDVSPQAMIDVVEMLRRVYCQGREDRGRELFQLPGDGDPMVDAVRERLLNAIDEWSQGRIWPSDGSGESQYMTPNIGDEVNGTLTLNVSPQRHMKGRQLRVRLVFEDV